MAIFRIGEAKTKLGLLVKQAAAGKPIYLLNGKAMVALVPARPTHETHEVSSSPDVLAINRRLAASEKTPKAAWVPGDARSRVLRSLRRRLGR